MSIPAEAFDPIIQELNRRPLETNKSRLKSGIGKSQIFGLVNSRLLPIDYSRLCWLRPYLYKLLLEFGSKYVKIPYTSIIITQNYKDRSKKTKTQRGVSFLVSFGDYTGGSLITGGEKKDIRTPLITDFSALQYEIEDFQGSRFSLMYYSLDIQNPLPPPSVIQSGSKFFFKRGDVIIKDGIPLVPRGNQLSIIKTYEPITITFT